MASVPPLPHFRAALYPVLDEWTGEPGFRRTVIRFAVRCAWDPSGGVRPGTRVVGLALIAPELPASVLPHLVRTQSNVAVTPKAPPTWPSQGLPSWRGIPSPVGSVRIWLANELDHHGPVDFPLTVLLPDRDPPGPPARFALLGMDFFKHYNVRVILEYPGIVYRFDQVTGRQEVDPYGACGSIEVY